MPQRLHLGCCRTYLILSMVRGSLYDWASIYLFILFIISFISNCTPKRHPAFTKRHLPAMRLSGVTARRDWLLCLIPDYFGVEPHATSILAARAINASSEGRALLNKYSHTGVPHQCIWLTLSFIRGSLIYGIARASSA